jgi:hypothetical protein
LFFKNTLINQRKKLLFSGLLTGPFFATHFIPPDDAEGGQKPAVARFWRGSKMAYKSSILPKYLYLGLIYAHRSRREGWAGENNLKDYF